MKTLDLLKVLFIFSILFTSCTDEDDNDPTNLPAVEDATTIASIASSTADFSTLTSALAAAGLVDTFNDANGEFTVFAPTNAAFESLLSASNGVSSFDDLSPEALDLLLKHHVVAGKVMAADLSDGQMVETLAGTKLEVNIANGVVTVGDVKVTTADVEASNGVIHIVEEVIVPTNALTIAQLAISESDFSTLVAALTKANLVTPFTIADNEYTVFAPTNDAFEAAGIDLDAVSEEDLQRILMHHVVSTKVLSTALSNGQMVETLAGTKIEVMIADGGVMINEASVLLADVEGINGVIHVVDEVLMPTTIIDVATSVGTFSSLIGALNSTDLLSSFNIDYMNGELKEYTVFAPNDTAFENLGDISGVTNAQLSTILTNHVVESKVLSTSLSDGQVITTLGGAQLTVSIMDGKVYIGGAEVIAADVPASNGVIHVISSVITE